MGDFDYDAYEKFALENLKDVWGGFGYDLASGSGEMAIRLKRNGFKVVGGDVSPEMLEKATEKARKARLDVPFVFSDLNDLHLEKKCDFVTAVCDGFNYVKGKNLAAAFNEIYSALNDGGIFIFDVSSANKLENVLGNNLFYEDDENLTYLWQNTKKGEKIKMDLTFFERDGDVYRRFDESESQYIHKTKDVESALTAAGFSYRFFNEKFKKYPARMKVAEKMIELGLSLNNDGKIYCGNLKISDKALAIAADVDRRAIKSTIEIIQNDEDLFNIFSNVLPAGTLLKNIAKNLNLGVIEIEVGSQNEGILAAITKIISKKGINIRQAYAEDNELEENPILTVITENPIDNDLISEFLKIKGVNRVSIY